MLVLVLASAFPASGQEPEPSEQGAGLSTAALIAAGVAAAALASRGGKDGGGDGASRSLSYTSAADWQTPEFAAQAGLATVHAQSLYWNGHYNWYVGAASDPAAGTGAGVKVAVGDMGINPVEARTGSSIAIDVAASYDYVANRPGSGADEYGHGTHVAGIIAAPRNGSGMHGLAYNATLVNFKLGDASGLITAGDAQRGDMLARAAQAGAMIANNSWATRVAITARSASELQAMMPSLIAEARKYVAAGGVVVFAAGNDSAAQPSMEAGLPYRISGLQAGWLAAVAIDESGALAGYSNRCGVAAAWCLAAPGGSFYAGLYSMQNNGGYDWMWGTSMAAPHISGALAALKSMFPNLSYQQLRERLLFTANRAGAYADASVYGQGLLDLQAASSPVGGLSVPTGSAASGATAPVEASSVQFPAGALRALALQSHVLAVDNYQRAPFWVPVQSFFREAPARIVERQWASLRTNPSSHAQGLNTVLSFGRFGFSQGAGGERVLGSQLALAWLPRLAAPGLDSLALGLAAEWRGTRFGLIGSIPGNSEMQAPLVEASSLGQRRALGAVAQRHAWASTYGVSLALADGFERPIGLAASGAFGVASGPAASTGVFARHALGRASLEASFEAAHFRPESSGILAAPDYVVRSANFGARLPLGTGTTLSASLKREWSGEAAELRLPLTIDEAGNIGAVRYALPYEDLVTRDSWSLRLDHTVRKDVSLRGSLTRERAGFGTGITGVAAVLVIAY